jgi:streptomycin 6-kinase
MNPIELPEKVRSAALARGEAGRAWLAALPGELERLARDWRLEIGRAAGGGTESYVVDATMADGRAAMLKIKLPGTDPGQQERRTLAAADGRGYARLLAASETGEALLTERLGRQLRETGRTDDAQMAAICATLQLAWGPAPAGPPFVTGAEKAAELAEVIETGASERSGPVCEPAAVRLALRFAERRRRAFDPVVAVLCHGDAHQWNTLEAPASPSGFKFIDPDGAFAERAFDLGIPMREWGPVVPDGDLLALGRHRCRLLADQTGVAPQPIWEWGLVQCVSNGYLLKEIGADHLAAVEFAVAAAFAAAPEV